MRVSAFIDGNNVFYMQRDHLRWSLDFEKLRQYIGSFGDVVDCIFYTGTGAPPEITQAKFLDKLAYLGYSIEQKPLKQIMQEDGTFVQKANLDIELVLDMFNQIDNYDLALLISGDGDFERPLKLLRARGKQFKVLSAPGSMSRELRMVAGAHYIDMSKMRAQFEWVNQPRLTSSAPTAFAEALAPPARAPGLQVIDPSDHP